MLTRGHKIAGPAAIVVLVCFFLPWVLVSCSGQPEMPISGWAFATGVAVPGSLQSSAPASDPMMFLFLLAILVVPGILYLAIVGKLTTEVTAYWLIGLGTFCIVLLLIKLLIVQQGGDRVEWTVTLQPGLWGVVLGCIAVVTSGVFDLRSTQIRRLGSTSFTRESQESGGSTEVDFRVINRTSHGSVPFEDSEFRVIRQSSTGVTSREDSTTRDP